MPLGNWRRANVELARIRRLEIDRNIAGLIAELSNSAGYGRHSVIRSHAADALGRLGDTRAVPHLIELADDPTDIARERAIAALGSLRASDAAPVFVERLQDSAPTVRMAAAEGLGQIGDPATIPALREVVEYDPHAEVRMYAAEALVELGDDEVQTQLPEIMRAVSRRVRGNPRWKRLKRLGDAS
jgi:HEAT repeat protein